MWKNLERPRLVGLHAADVVTGVEDSQTVVGDDPHLCARKLPASISSG